MVTTATRWWLPFGFATALLVSLNACSVGDGNDAVPDPPFVMAPERDVQGVVLIVIDTLRADHVGVYGREPTLTPALDALAARSLVFESAVAPSSWTRPSVASILTSRYPTSLGVLDKEDRLPESALLLPEILQQQLGFRTYAVSTNGNTKADFGFDQGYDAFRAPPVRRNYPDGFAIYIAESVSEEGIRMLDEHPDGVPFFLFLHYVDPHDPYLPHPGLLEEPEPAGRFDGSRKALNKLRKTAPEGLTADDYARVKYLYAGEVRYCDLWIGHFLKELEKRGLMDKTMVVVTSDHGEGLWDHEWRGHGQDLFEETVSVPLIMHLPGMTEGEGIRIGEPVSLVDITPTILAALDVDASPLFQGYDLYALSRGKRRHPALSYIYSEMDHRGRDFESIRYDDLKLIRNRGSEQAKDVPPWQLYDLAADPAEEANVVQRPGGQRDRLQAALKRWSLALTASATQRTEVQLSDLDQETLDSLRALGYIGASEHSQATRGGGKRREAADAHTVEIGGPPPGDLTPALDFDASMPSLNQIVGALRVDQQGSADLEGEATIWLPARKRSRRWQVVAEHIAIDGANEATRLDVIANGSSSMTHFREAGIYTVEGDLPENVRDIVRLELVCSRPESGEAAASAGPCLRIHGVSLR